MKVVALHYEITRKIQVFSLICNRFLGFFNQKRDFCKQIKKKGRSAYVFYGFRTLFFLKGLKKYFLALKKKKQPNYFNKKRP